MRVEPSGNPQANAGPESPKKGTLTTVQHQLSAAAGATNGGGAASGPSGLPASSTAHTNNATLTPANVASQNGAGSGGQSVSVASAAAARGGGNIEVSESDSQGQIPTSNAAEMTMAPPSAVASTGSNHATQLGHSVKQVAI